MAEKTAKDKAAERERKRKERKLARKRQVRRQLILIVILTLIFTAGYFTINRMLVRKSAQTIDQADANDLGRPAIDVQLLTVNEYSRPGSPLNQINNIVIHYTGNPGSSAQGNRDYFESLKDTHTTKASSHYVVGLDGEIIQCIPTAEISYASNNRNSDTISIEVCHEDETGKFSDTTYNSLVHLTAWLCNRTGLEAEDVIRHYDVTEKICPKYYVENEDAWIKLKADVAEKKVVLSEL